MIFIIFQPPPPSYDKHYHKRKWWKWWTAPWTDNDSSLLLAALGKPEPLISTAACQKFDLDPWSWTQPLTLTSEKGNNNVKTRFWHLTLTYDPTLARVKVDPCAKKPDCRSNSLAVRAHANGQTNGRTLPNLLPPCFAKAMWSIINDSVFGKRVL